MTNPHSIDKVRNLSNRKLGPGTFDALSPVQQATLARYYEHVNTIATAAKEIAAIGIELTENGYPESGELMLTHADSIRKVFTGKV